MSRYVKWWLPVVGMLVTSLAAAQGVLVDHRLDHGFRLPRPHIIPGPRPLPRPTPQPPQTYKIQELAVNANLSGQVAKVQVTQSFVNTGSRVMEVSFLFPLPYDGAVDQMTFLVDGKEYPAKLLNAAEARRIYEGHIRRNEDPALLEWIGTGMFQTSVFPVPPGAKRTVTLRYSQLCRKSDGVTEWLFPLSTAKYTSQPVERVVVDVSIQSEVPLKNIYSPTHSIALKRPTGHQAQVSYQGAHEIPSADFRLMYDTSDQAVGASVLSYRPDQTDEGYFLMLVSPDIERGEQSPIPKTVVFVVDRSGSMSGKKIEQAKGALKFVLNNLREGDLFNIITYDSHVESFRPELQRFTESTRGEAIGFADSIYAGGSTNIDGALQAALGQLQDDSRPNYIVFLTDGLPTAGEQREPQIVANAQAANRVRARVFSFGVGYDVNSRLLDRLSRAGFGQSHYVRPDEDIEAHVSKLYARIGAPVLVDIRLEVDLEGFPAERGSPVSRVYPRDAFDLFAGDQLVLVGRYKQPGAARITIRGTVEGSERKFDFPATLVDRSPDETQAFIEKLWAMRRVGEIIDQIDLQGKNQELVDELVALATRHGILTPYTSFLADEAANPRDLAASRARAGGALDELRLESGASAFGQRLWKRDFQQVQQAPGSGFAPGMPGGTIDGGLIAGGVTPQAGPGMPRLAGRGGMGSGAATGPPSGTLSGQPGEERASGVVSTVLHVGTKTFFWRNNRWEDSTLTEPQLERARRVERFSAEYFDLQTRFGKEVAKYLAIEQEVVVVLDDQAYQF